MNFEELKERYTEEIFDICLEDQKVYPAGDNQYLTSAPYREDRNPSMSFNIEKGVFYDFALGKGGDVIELYCLTFNRNKKEALEELNYRFGGF